MNFANKVRKQTYKSIQRKILKDYILLLKRINSESKNGNYETYYYYDGLFKNEFYINIGEKLENKGFKVEIEDLTDCKTLLISWR